MALRASGPGEPEQAASTGQYPPETHAACLFIAFSCCCPSPPHSALQPCRPCPGGSGNFVTNSNSRDPPAASRILQLRCCSRENFPLQASSSTGTMLMERAGRERCSTSTTTSGKRLARSRPRLAQLVDCYSWGIVLALSGLWAGPVA